MVKEAPPIPAFHPLVPLPFLSVMKSIALLLGLTIGIACAGQPEFSDVFTAGTDTYKSIRIPSVVVAKSGAVLAFAEGRSARTDQAQNDIILKRSRDGGKSWDALQVIADDGAHSLNNPTAVVERESGRVFLMYQRIPAHLKEHSAQTATGYEGTNIVNVHGLEQSADGGSRDGAGWPLRCAWQALVT